MTLAVAGGILAILAVLFVWLIGEYLYTHWHGISRWDASRRVRRAMRRHVDRTSANPYSSAFRRGFWYGLVVGAGVVGLAWRIWR